MSLRKKHKFFNLNGYSLSDITQNEANSIFDFINSWLHEQTWDMGKIGDKEKILNYLNYHGLGGIFGKMNLEGQIINSPNNSLQQVYFTNSINHEKTLSLCKKMVEICALHKIPISILKGPALSHDVFEDSGLRSYGDIDIFTDTRENAIKLLSELGSDGFNDKGEDTFTGRLKDPHKLSAVINGIELEIMYLNDQVIDPMHEFLSRNRQKILAIPEKLSDLLSPEPSIHLVFLLLHMGVNHLCSRLIWFIDLIVLYKEKKHCIDIEWINSELKSLELESLSSEISIFCKQYLSDEFPLISEHSKQWNSSFIRFTLMPKSVINARFKLKKGGCLHRYLILFLYPFVNFLIGNTDRPIKNLAMQRTSNRLSHGLRSSSGKVSYIASIALLLPISWLIGLSFNVISFLYPQRG